MKTIAVILGALVALVVAAMLLMDYSERSESHFKTYRELEQSEMIGKGWVPAFIPESAYDIHERHRVDQPYVSVRFKFKPGDIAKIEASCTVASSIGSTTSTYRCKHESDFFIAKLTADGAGEIVSE